LRARPDADVSVVDAAKGTRVASSLDSFAKLQQAATDTHYYSDGHEAVIHGLSKDNPCIIHVSATALRAQGVTSCQPPPPRHQAPGHRH
jgi:hypothetical protein